MKQDKEKEEFLEKWYLWDQDKEGTMTTCGEDVWQYIQSLRQRDRERAERDGVAKIIGIFIAYLENDSDKEYFDRSLDYIKKEYPKMFKEVKVAQPAEKGGE